MSMRGSRYGQYCPLAMASELLCNRWTMLLVRELLDGSTTFNDIARGVPMMSRNLLSRRLKELEAAGIVSRIAAGQGLAGATHLTPAGEALGAIVRSMAGWGQEWIDIESSVETIDARFLMWDIRRNVKPLPEFPPRFTVRFFLSDAEKSLREHWLVFESEDVDLCYGDPGHPVDVEIVTDLRTMTEVWMGWRDFGRAVAEQQLVIWGDKAFAKRAREWLGLSKLAGTKKRAKRDQVGRRHGKLTR